MNYNETLSYLYNSLPMYQRVGQLAYKPNLDNTHALDSYLGHPHKSFITIHIAGTNGKGSVSHMLAAILQKNGYKTGLYTSPHLFDFRERIRVDGEMISENDVVRFFELHRMAFDTVQPSFFEMTVALAFDHFRQQKVDVAVIETGMGGRFDSTNIITPVLSVITNISLDHTQFLGDTLEAIAAEKAGIIKPGVPVVIGETHGATETVFRSFAHKQQAPIYFADQQFNISDTEIHSRYQKLTVSSAVETENYGIDLQGVYQQKNLLAVLAALKQLRRGGFKFQNLLTKQALQNVKTLTGLRGRWDVISEQPLTVCETGHNQGGIKEMLHQLNYVQFERLHMVLGMVNDKEPEGILNLLPANAYYYFTKASIPRAMAPDILKMEAAKFGLAGKVYHSVAEAVKAAQQTAKKSDLILVTGSIFLVADALQYFNNYQASTESPSK
jgi:dihydrofolate synthase / folylpolyglutamate synthase